MNNQQIRPLVCGSIKINKWPYNVSPRKLKTNYSSSETNFGGQWRLQSCAVVFRGCTCTRPLKLCILSEMDLVEPFIVPIY